MNDITKYTQRNRIPTREEFHREYAGEIVHTDFCTSYSGFKKRGHLSYTNTEYTNKQFYYAKEMEKRKNEEPKLERQGFKND